MKGGWSAIRDSSDFINKIKSLNSIPSNSILITADVVGLCPTVPHESILNAIKEHFTIGKVNLSLLRIYQNA